jgi:hypothetical protein
VPSEHVQHFIAQVWLQFVHRVEQEFAVYARQHHTLNVQAVELPENEFNTASVSIKRLCLIAGRTGCDIGSRLAYYICLWVVIGVVGIWFLFGVVWMAAIWFHASLPSFSYAMETFDQIESEDVSESGHLSEA